MSVALAKLGKIVFTKAFKATASAKNGQFMKRPTESFSYLITGKGNKKIPKLVQTALIQTSKMINLFQTPMAVPTLLTTALASGGIGYLLGNKTNNDDKDMGLVVEKEEQKDETQKENNALPEAIMTEEQIEDYHTITTGGRSWSGIVQAYYPDLVEKCNGQLYGKDGAIRKLKEALQKDSDIDLINASDIPRTLNLPLEIDGAKINDKAVAPKEKVSVTGGHTDIEEAGAKNTTHTYTVTDEKRNKSYTAPDSASAVDSLKVRTGVHEYNVKKAS